MANFRQRQRSQKSEALKRKKRAQLESALARYRRNISEEVPTFWVHTPLDLVPAGAYIFASVVEGILAAALQDLLIENIIPDTVEEWGIRTADLRFALEAVSRTTTDKDALRRPSDDSVAAVARLNRVVADVYDSYRQQKRIAVEFLSIRAVGSMNGTVKINVDLPELIDTSASYINPTLRRKRKEELRHLEETNRAEEWKQRQTIAEKELELAEKRITLDGKRFKMWVEQLQLMVAVNAISEEMMARMIADSIGLANAAIDTADATQIARVAPPELPPGSPNP